jgi:hypothetical protein
VMKHPSRDPAAVVERNHARTLDLGQGGEVR